VSASKSFNDIARDRKGGPSELTTELEPLERRKPFQRKLMQPNEQVVRALPGHE
jgi:hypothetical protein